MEKIKFEELDISQDILKAIDDMGFEETTPIQTKAIPFILGGRDVIGHAQTGTGKTAAFGIPILDRVDPSDKSPQAIVLCPTRELAIQVAEELNRLAKYKRNLSTLPVYGGQSINRQIKALKKGVQVIIGTPGRVMDHMNRRTLNLSRINTVVLDEADVMLDMGFIEDIETILSDVPNQRQTLFFSATIPREILNLSKRFQNNAEFVKVTHERVTVPGIEQYYYEVRRGSKLRVLTRLIDLYSPRLALVFCNTRKMVDELNIQLQSRGYLTDALHGGLNQNQRDRVMDKFRNGVIDILIATDVAARGIDVDDVEAVFNYDVPQDTDYYVHRIGRTGRMGKAGQAHTLVVGKDIYKLRDIQKYTKTRIARQEVPTISEIQEARIEQFIDNLTGFIQEEHLGKHIKIIESLLEEDYTAIELAAALLKMALQDTDDEVVEENIGDTGAEPGMVRLFMNIGKKDRIGPGNIVGAITGETGINGKLIGAIDMYDKFTFVEVPRENANEVLKIMKDNYIKGTKINIEPAKPK
ncbi:MAG: DEAD/DEAH box helicase [Halanaerobium sp.]|nr:DEAD/DEAH box helicase [Halanaerobium sp.]